MKVSYKTISKCTDYIFWAIITFLPIILYLFYLTNDTLTTTITFNQFLNTNLGIVFDTNSIVYSSLSKLFISGNGFFDIFTNGQFLLDFLVWLFVVEFAHCIIDFLLFIPRFTRDFLDKFNN